MNIADEYEIYHADSHYYEPDECFTRHIETAYGRAVRVVRDEGKYARIYLGQERSHFFSVSPGEVTGPPGSFDKFLRSGGEGGNHLTQNAICGTDFPEYVNRDARLRWMDERGITSLSDTSGHRHRN